MTLKKLILIFFSSLVMSGCGLMTENRNYANIMDNNDFFTPEEDFPIVQGDHNSGYNEESTLKRIPLQGKKLKKYQLSTLLTSQLKNLEHKLSEIEYEHYLQNKNKLPTKSEKIYFIRLGSIYKRNLYLKSKGYNDHQIDNTLYTVNGISARRKNIYTGMTKGAVIEVMGEPHSVEIAGNPNFENEKWNYMWSGRERAIIFQNGLVRGWD